MHDTDRVPALADILESPWHALPVDAAARLLRTGDAGLSDEEAAARLAAFGGNRLPRPQQAGPLVVYLRQFRSPLIYLLLAAALVSLGIGELTDAAFIFVVLQVNAAIGAVQEWKAASSAMALDTLIEKTAVVIRGGVRRQVDAAALVPGDAVELAAGALTPADIRLTACRELRVDESLLTGESLPVEKDPNAVLPGDTPLGDRATMLHAGAVVRSGRATGMVARTGPHTEIGRIAQALAAADLPPPPLVQRLERFAWRVGYAMLGVIAALATVQFLQGFALSQVFLVAVALAVAAIPEGMPVAITVALAIGTRRMARRNVIVRALPAVEGLGACTMIASDKTGTLTVNELTVRRLWLPGHDDFEVGGEGYRPDGTLTQDGGAPADAALAAARRLAETGALCNEASLTVGEDGTVRHFGDTVDVAFLALAGKLGVDFARIRERTSQGGGIPYEPHLRFAASFTRAEDGTVVAHVKGAAETVVPMCAGIDRDAVLAETQRLAGAGYRVLAVARGPVDDSKRVARPDGLQGLEFLGLVGLIDPLRPEVSDAVTACRRAGVGVAMVTGDHPATALAIARELGIAADGEHVVTGAELQALGDDPAGLRAVVAEAHVFARVEPNQKLLLVQALQQAGHFVAVTGDGVNDAPALGAANIGVAMGRGGTDVARGASDLILADDNFASIVGGVEEGRIAYDNVRKVIYLLVTTGVGELVLFMLAIAFGLPLPLFAVQLLWLNLVTNGIQDVALAFEKGEPGILDRRPRPPRQPLFDRRMIEQVLLTGSWMGAAAFAMFWYLLDRGMPEAEARSIVLLLMVLFENVHAVNARSERRSAFRVPLAANPFLVLAVIAAQAVHVAAMFIPGLSDVLGIAPVSPATWLAVAGSALSLTAVAEIYKFLRQPGDDRPVAASSGSTRSR
jgi:magnesium-transporting ATPase (P-type)